MEDGAGRKRVALYIRVSTGEQAEHGFSVPEQKRDLLAWAEREGWEVVAVIADEGHSGAVGVRPGLDRIMELAEAGEIDAVLAKRRARLFRDRYLRMGYERSLLEHGVRLLALDDGGHRLADAVMDEFGDWWRDQIRDATAAGRMEKARQGHIVGSSSPLFGFRFVRDEHRRVVGYEVDPADMEVVRRVIEAVGAEGTVYGAKRTLEAEGIPSPSGSFVWRESTIRRIVFNGAYYPHDRAHLIEMLAAAGSSARLTGPGPFGVVFYPRTRMERLEPDPARGYARATRSAPYDRADQVPIPVPYGGVSRASIDAARNALKNNVPSRSTSGRAFELSGILRCALCGGRMSTCRRRDRRGEYHYHYYGCASNQRHGSQGCPMNRGYRVEKLERLVLDAVLDAVKDREELTRKAHETYEQEKRRIVRQSAVQVGGWERTLSDVERQRARVQHAYAEGVIELQDLRARLSEMDAQRQRAERLQSEHEDKKEKLADLQAARDKAIFQIQHGKWRELGITAPEERRERYREIGLSASADVEGTVRLSWGLGE